MKRFRCFLFIPAAAAVVAISLADVAFAQKQTPLRGKMFIAGKTVIDPPKNEARNTHAYLVITGAAAIRMYRAMRAKAKNDLCRGDGWRIKSAGPLACAISRGGKRAECDFSVSLATGQSSSGQAC